MTNLLILWPSTHFSRVPPEKPRECYHPFRASLYSTYSQYLPHTTNQSYVVAGYPQLLFLRDLLSTNFTSKDKHHPQYQVLQQFMPHLSSKFQITRQEVRAYKRYHGIWLQLAEEERKRLCIIYLQCDPYVDLDRDMTWAKRANQLQRAYIALVTANAYVSTLGGGHFLCRHFKQSQMLAKFQMAIGKGLGNGEVVFQCKVHLVYNAIHSGHFDLAERMLRKLQPKRRGEPVDPVVYSAQVYLKKVRKLHKTRELKIKSGHTLVDNFYRQRI